MSQSRVLICESFAFFRTQQCDFRFLRSEMFEDYGWRTTVPSRIPYLEVCSQPNEMNIKSEPASSDGSVQFPG
jgi:hypothetical protein